MILLLESHNDVGLLIKGIYTQRYTASHRVLLWERRTEHEWYRGKEIRAFDKMRKPSKLSALVEKTVPREEQERLIHSRLGKLTELVLVDPDKGGPWTTSVGWYLLET